MEDSKSEHLAIKALNYFQEALTKETECFTKRLSVLHVLFFSLEGG